MSIKYRTTCCIEGTVNQESKCFWNSHFQLIIIIPECMNHKWVMTSDWLETSMLSWTNHFEFMYLKRKLLIVRLRSLSISLKGLYFEKQVTFIWFMVINKWKSFFGVSNWKCWIINDNKLFYSFHLTSMDF